MLMSILTKFIISIKHGIKSRLDYLSLQLISLFLGFYIATIISTIPSQTGDWGIIAGAIIVTFTESLSKIIYSFNNRRTALIYTVNCIKIGIIYGLFVDAFKLGS
uniref:Uncharacterized protein ycf20 n=2 Tax=Grateloupia TaxID=31454 RepID=A0A2S1FXB1_9FLOR|nr:Ycf20 [Grateloupia filicina]AWD77401.1 Ycf20 [Grateloupia filicina]